MPNAGNSRPETAKGRMTTLSGFFRWAVDVAGIARSNPMEGLRIVEPETKARLRFCDAVLRDRLIAECPRDDLKFILYCGFHAGMRKNEIIQARAEWFRLDVGRIDVSEGQAQNPGEHDTEIKMHQHRFIPITQAFRTFLETYGLRSPYMLHPEVKQGKSPYRYNFQKPFADYMSKQECLWVTPHVLRHTFASLHLMAGTSIYKVAKWMGDRVDTVQKHYGHLAHDDEDIERQFKKPELAKVEG